MATIAQPHELVIELPGGRSLRHISKLTFVMQEKGTVVSVTLVPTMQTFPYQRALDELEQILKDWDCRMFAASKEQLAISRKMNGDLQPGNQSPQPGGATIAGETKANIGYQISPATTGWFLSITVALTVEEGRKLMGLPPHATTRPTSVPSEDAKPGRGRETEDGGTYRTASNLAYIPSLLVIRDPNYTVDDVSVAVGVVPNPIADQNIDAGTLGWGSGSDFYNHSDFQTTAYPLIYAWWRKVFAGNGDNGQAGVPMGQD